MTHKHTTFALVGCGRISKRHAELLGNGKIKDGQLLAVCDLVDAKAAATGESYGVPAYNDMHKMMEAEKPDVVVVLTESGNHARDVVALSNYGAHIIVEKPMALTVDDADRMIMACDRANVKLFVIKQNRFNVPVRKLREAVLAGRLGKLVLGTVRVRWCRPQAYYDQDSWRGTWLLDGGVLTNQASHHIDLLEWMMGEVESVSAMTSRSLVDIEAEDTGIALLKFKNGALGIVEATTATRPSDLEGSISILGEGGNVEIAGFAVNEMKNWNFVKPIEGDDEVLSGFSTNPPDVYGFGHKEYYDHVIEAIRNNGPNLVDGIEGRKSIELINAIYESTETGQRVNLRFRAQNSRLGKA